MIRRRAQMEWPTFEPDEDPLAALVKLSRYYGAAPGFVLAGGGNTSVKIGETLHVKASGRPLAQADKDSFVALRRADLAALLERDLGRDPIRREERFKEAILAARLAPEGGLRPSVESVLHDLMPLRFVVHTHPTTINMLTCCTEAERLFHETFGAEAIWIPFTDPGFMLAKRLAEELRRHKERTGLDRPPAVIMQNHGLVVCGDTPEEIRNLTDMIVGRIRRRVGSSDPTGAFGPVSLMDKAAGRRAVETIGPALRGLMGSGERLKVVAFDDSGAAAAIAGGSDGAKAACGGPLTPDQIVYCRAFPLWFETAPDEPPRQVVERLRAAVRGHEERTGFPPHVVIAKGLGVFAAGDSPPQAATVMQVYLDAVRVMAGAARLGGIHYMTPEQREFIEHWEVESYRRQVAAGKGPSGRVAGKVALVTGAAQGVGLEIARAMASQGAFVALCDINDEGARRAAGEIGAERALGLPMDVTSSASVDDAVHRTVRAWGGIDVLICNAGVLKAGSVKTQPEKDFRMVASVNYVGYFLCVKKTAPIMAVQHLARPECWGDIIQINSKSGLQGSSRNAAYAGSKFGGIGLTQSFAMELVEDGIKVNAVCPGNFFDLPLWTDPKEGLFVQYLRAGKVPGAATVDDVRRAYEAKVPMGRGCRVEDLMKAIYYLIEQKYETGQALPVTGGQVMLS